MNDNPDVKLPVTCNRTGKVVEEKIPLNEVETFLASIRSRQGSAVALREVFSSLEEQEGAPDLVAYYKGRLVILPVVLDKHDTAVLRALHDATQSDTFPRPAPKKNTKSGKSLSTPAVVEE